MTRFNKAIAAFAGVAAIIASAMADGIFASEEKEAIALALVSAIFVFFVPNKPPAPPEA